MTGLRSHHVHPPDRDAPRLPAGFSRAEFLAAHALIRRCPRYQATPLHSLEPLARGLGLGALLLKDESRRFGLRSFKGLGGPHAVIQLALQRLHHRGQARLQAQDLIETTPRPGRELTVACASAGNHGQGVAAGARLIGARCRVFLPARTEPERVAAIEAFGAEVVRVEALYDETVAEARRQARQHDWLFVPDSSLHGDREAARQVMLAYGSLLEEAVVQMQAAGHDRPSHLFIQGGVGGLPAAVAAWAAGYWGRERPRLVVVESARADCLLESARAGRAVASPGDLETGMRGMDCAQPSPLAWSILEQTADHFLSIEDAVAEDMIRRLADHGIHASLSAVAGMAPLPLLARDTVLARTLGLGPSSVVLALLSEAGL